MTESKFSNGPVDEYMNKLNQEAKFKYFSSL